MRWTQYILILCLFFGAGCSFFSPLRKLDRITDNLAKTEKKIDVNKEALTEKAKGYTYAADFAISLNPFPSMYDDVAKGFLERSLLITGNPSTSEAIELRKLVQDLLSTNEVIRADGQKRLELKDKQIIGLEVRVKSLNDTLGEQEGKYQKIVDENTALAQKFYNFWKWFKIIFFSILTLFLLWIGLKVYSIFNPLVGIGMNAAKVPFNIVKDGFTHVIQGGERFKKELEQKIEDPELKNQLLELFKISQEAKQSPEVQNLIKDLTKK